jgi:Cupin domain
VALTAPGHRVVHVDELERIDATGHGWWRPVRRRLGLTGFGANASTADHAGDPVVEPHDERSPGAGGHQELYVVLAGRATFTVDGEEVDAPQGTLLAVEPGVHRRAVATEDATTVLVVGGPPGAALPVSPFEYWYAAQPHYLAGDYARAIELAAEGLEEHPGHAQIHYQLACFRALDGDREGGLADLIAAVAADPRTAEWAAGDADLDSIRDDPRFPAA